MNLNEKVETIQSELKNSGLEADVSVKTKGRIFKKTSLSVIVSGVSDDISVSSNVQHILRNIVGYGQVDVGYDISKNRLTLEYTPIVKVFGIEKKVVSNHLSGRTIQREVYSTPGSTPYEK